MTQSASSGATGDGQGSRIQVARRGAAEAGQRISQAGGGLAHSVADRGRGIATEAGHQAQNLVGQASAQLREQAGIQQQRAADGLRSLGDQLRAMSDRADRPGIATDLVRQAADRVHQAARWLDQREPGMVLEEVREYARRRPGIFLAGAAVAGVIAGRLTRSKGGVPGGGPQPGTHPDGTRAPASGAPRADQLSDSVQHRLAEMERARPSEPAGDGRAGEVRR